MKWRVWATVEYAAPSHTAAVTQYVIEDHGIEIVPHPPYSPDLAPCDFFLFLKLKDLLRVHHYPDDDALLGAVLC